MAQELVLKMAGTGSRFRPGLNRNIPLTTEQVIGDMLATYEADVRYYHYHTLDDNGDHISMAQRYEEVGRWARKNLPGMYLSFATSRGGAVNNQIIDFITQNFGQDPGGNNSDLRRINNLTTEQFYQAEMVRAGCLSVAADARPHVCTTFTGAEIRADMSNASLFSGYTDVRKPNKVLEGYMMIAQKATDLGVMHEVEMTTYTTKGREAIQRDGRAFDTFGKDAPKSSFKVLMDFVERGLVGKPLSIVLLPGFSNGFPLEPGFIDKAIDDAHTIIERNGGKGFISIGAVLTPNLYDDVMDPSTRYPNPLRDMIIRKALKDERVKVLRVGIEDGPLIREKIDDEYMALPKSNAEIARYTGAKVLELGGKIITDPEKVKEVLCIGSKLASLAQPAATWTGEATRPGRINLGDGRVD